MCAHGCFKGGVQEWYDVEWRPVLHPCAPHPHTDTLGHTHGPTHRHPYLRDQWEWEWVLGPLLLPYLPSYSPLYCHSQCVLPNFALHFLQCQP